MLQALGLAALIGFSIALIVFALRRDLLDRFERDVAWLEHMVWRFTPDPFDGRRYVLMYYVASISLLLLLLWVFPSKVMALIVWIVLAVLPKIVINMKWEKRRKEIHQQLPGSVTKLSSSVASGMSLIDAIKRLGEREPQPIATEYQIIANYWNMGADFESTIEEARRRLRLQDFNLLASALVINQRMGGNVVVTLERLANSLVEIDRMRREVYVATAEGRQSIITMFFAPFIMLGIIALIDAPAVGMLFTKPMGNVLLGVALILDLMGTLWAWKIVHADI
ncbi:MAG: type II secretion system F family protein [Planctomycetota bacterium JB042]